MVRAKMIAGVGIVLTTAYLMSTIASAPTEEVTQPTYTFETETISREFMEARLEPEIIIAETTKAIEWLHFEATAYSIDTCDKSPDDPLYGITSTGKYVKENHTIAVDPRVIPYGSAVYIEGTGVRYAEDCGSAIKGNEIDIYLPSTKEALAYGRQPIRLYIMEEE